MKLVPWKSQQSIWTLRALDTGSAASINVVKSKQAAGKRVNSSARRSIMLAQPEELDSNLFRYGS